MRAAMYARFSTDKQSEHSIEDQLRVCERIAERHHFTTVARFTDAAISGGTTQREGYQNLLEAARRHEFEVIVAEDTSRLWRALAEQAPRLAELRDLGVHVVTHDLDTRLESAGILGAVNGAMSEHYRQEIARRTRRGLEGRARAGKATGGRAYGYIAATDSRTGEREIESGQAEIICRIFNNMRLAPVLARLQRSSTARASLRPVPLGIAARGVCKVGWLRRSLAIRPAVWGSSITSFMSVG